MIRDTLPINEFRQDQAAVASLRTFLATREGQMFAKALRGAHPLVSLTDTQEQAKGLRDASIVEGSSLGITSTVLGKLEGYEMCLKTIDLLTTENSGPAPSMDRQPARVAKILRTPQ